MINKKNLLGKEPDSLGLKDAIHTAIVAVRAGGPIKPGQRCGLNKDREAVPDAKGPGVADPFLKTNLTRGQSFWLLLCQDEVPNVQHVWEHPSVDFTPPTIETKRNSTLAEYADDFGVTYEQLMAAAAYVVAEDQLAPYPGNKSGVEVETANDKIYDLWYEWSDETGHEFENEGTACCPEYAHPNCGGLFQIPS
jgi:hypothetical protein